MFNSNGKENNNRSPQIQNQEIQNETYPSKINKKKNK